MTLDTLTAQILAGLAHVVATLSSLLWSLGSPFSIVSLLIAAGLGLAFLVAQRLRRGRRLKLRVLIRALFPRRSLKAATSPSELGWFGFNVLLFGVLFGWAMASYKVVGEASHAWLVSTFGALPASPIGGAASAVILTVALFLAYEFGFWFDHLTSHKLKIFWHFHQVHHRPKVLTPLTNFRIHPVEGIKFANVLAVTMGLTFGVTTWLLGSKIAPLEIAGRNAALLPFVLVMLHLQHTHLWIAFTGVWGRLLISPAHHQIHHSDAPADFGKNLGSYLSVFDWLFGTLRMPKREREPLSFGLGVQPPAFATPIWSFSLPAWKTSALSAAGRTPR